MKRKLIFKKLVNGYKAHVKWKVDDQSVFKGILSPDKPLPITGEISIKKGEIEIKGEKKEFKKLKIPEFDNKRISKFGIKEREEEPFYSMTYPLIPENPEKDEPIMAYAKIQWNQEKNQHEYIVVQPEAPRKMKRLIIKLKEMLEEKLDLDFSKLKKQEAKSYLKQEAFKLLDYFGIKLSNTEKDILTYFIERDFLGLGKIEPLMHDPNIEDISCDGIGTPIYIFHRNPSLGSIPTNISFSNKDELDSYLIRLAQLCGQSISVIDPLLQGSLPDGSRIQGTLATDIARKGSNFTIRKFTQIPLTCIQLLNYNTIDIKTLAFLWLAVDYGCSVLISGGTASGKTTFLNALSSFIRPDMKIVSIEDTAELKLMHPHWIPQVARTSISTEQGKERGQIDLFDLLIESMRQRPDYIIVGEVRGREAYVLFQQMATGHPSFATIHADSMEKLINRLVTPPISLSPSLIESLDLIVFLQKLRYKGNFVRKLSSVHEVVGFDKKSSDPTVNKIFEWNAERDEIEIKDGSTILGKILKKVGMDEKELLEELKRRMIILFWAKERGITDYRTFSQIVNIYYNYPEKVLDIISGEI
jgi:flagellar protein FlaI